MFIFHIGSEESSGSDDPVPDPAPVAVLPATAMVSLGNGIPDWACLPTREGDVGLWREREGVGDAEKEEQIDVGVVVGVGVVEVTEGEAGMEGLGAGGAKKDAADWGEGTVHSGLEG